jgi:hypothetical protein
MKLAHALAAAVLAAMPLASHAQNLVTNGSFEQDAPEIDYWKITPTLIGWTGAPDIELRNNYDGTAQDGVNFVELDTFENSAMSQVIHATGLVELSFWYAARQNVAAGSNDLSFSLGDLSGTVLEGVAGGETTEWLRYTGIADLGLSGTATLTFAALGLSDEFGGSLDNISVTAVPEPGTVALMLLGLGAVVVAAGRRQG